MPSLRDVHAAMDEWYPPATAESWDAVGLTCGDPDEPVESVLLAVDCVPATVDEAIECSAQLLITHHPLLLSGVYGVPTTDPKGRLIHRMIRAGIAHLVAHTNADVAATGVSVALAECLGLLNLIPIEPDPTEPLDQLSVYVPPPDLDRLITALETAGAGQVGHYDRCTFTVAGTGTYRPLAGADPADGVIGELTTKEELKLSMVLPRRRRAAVLAAMRSAHPYEEVAFELSEQPVRPGPNGTGRLGRLPEPTTLTGLLELVAQQLPATVEGVRAAGDPEQPVATVAVCGGSGATYTDAARAAGADAYLTSDLKHHSTLEAVAERAGFSSAAPMALIDAAHWATERPWLDRLADQLSAEFGSSITVTVSDRRTDPWTLHRGQL